MKYKINNSNISRSEGWDKGFITPEDTRNIRTKKRPLSYNTFILCLIGIVYVFAVGRMFFVYLKHFDTFAIRANNNAIRNFDTLSSRGLIYDRLGTPLVKNITTNIVYVVPADIPRATDTRNIFFEKLASFIPMTAQEIEEIVYPVRFSFHPVEIIRGVDHKTFVDIHTHYQGNITVFVDQVTSRHYIYDSVYAHIIGYMAPINESNVKLYTDKGYRSNEFVGVAGLEKQYEHILRTDPVEKTLHVDSRGNIIHENQKQSLQKSHDLHLSLIHDLQYFTFTEFSRYLRNIGKNAGVVIVSHPKSGEILSLVSLPSYSANIFNDGIHSNEIGLYQSYLESPFQPFINRAISGLYPPGSTFKIISTSSVLEEGVLAADELVFSPGFIKTVNKDDPDIVYIHKDWNEQGHGDINIIEAIAESSDTFFYKVIGGYEDMDFVGIDRLEEYAKLWNIGSKTGIDLPGELEGLMPNPEWKLEKTNSLWTKGDSYNIAIGQGYLLTTPLQAHMYMATVANNGVISSPQMVKDNYKSTDQIRIGISDQTIQTIQKGLRSAVDSESGTAKALKYFSVPLAGKTATAQFDNNKQEHAWFSAYGPYDDPEVVVTVLIEAGGGGSKVALPMTQKILQYYFDNKYTWDL